MVRVVVGVGGRVGEKVVPKVVENPMTPGQNQKLTGTLSANQMQKMQMIALDLVRYHLGKDWSFQWKFNIRATGICWQHRNLIEVSVYDAVKYGLDEFVETVLHEIAHAMSKEGHTPAWKATYLMIGGNGTVTTDESIVWESIYRERLLKERGKHHGSDNGKG